MARISFTPNLVRHHPVPAGSIRGATVGEVLDNYFAGQPQLRGYVLDDQGGVRDNVALFLNNELIRDRRKLSDPVGDDDELYIAQALSGG